MEFFFSPNRREERHERGHLWAVRSNPPNPPENHEIQGLPGALYFSGPKLFEKQPPELEPSKNIISGGFCQSLPAAAQVAQVLPGPGGGGDKHETPGTYTP